jgi:hypothetical protein
MAIAAPEMVKLGLAPQRAMFALELIDPIRGMPVSAGLAVTAEGLRAPALTPSNRFVWLDRGQPIGRSVRVKVLSADGMFASYEEVLDVPANEAEVATSALIFRRTLRPTGRYEPPVGMIAVGGMLVEGGGSRLPLAGAEIRIHFSYADAMETFVGIPSFSDARGGFVAVVGPLGDVRPDPIRERPDSFMAWLTVAVDGVIRTTPPQALRFGRLNRLPALLEWAALGRVEVDEFA